MPRTYSSQVKFTRVPDLIEKRKVFMKGGWVYVPARDHSSIVFQTFETELVKALEVHHGCSWETTPN